MTDTEAKIAVFIDFENIALGVREAKYKTFELAKVLERIVEKGKIVVKKAYADWEGYGKYKRTFHESGIELIEIPRKAYSGKNSADIRMVVDAMDLCYAKDHINLFAICSGDSDFSPLVAKLKENDKYVLGLGVRNSCSNLLVDNCDEFVYYEDLVREPSAPENPAFDKLPAKQKEAFQRLYSAIKALIRQDKEVIWGSMVKQALKRRYPEFNEGYYGYSSFSRLLEDAQKKKLITLEKDSRSGTYIVHLEE
ncbi:MAG: NYN domain-containing protein [Planctomycetota bacterium]|nr:NYN domain-containing protein [Planctomycetota bacterium]